MNQPVWMHRLSLLALFISAQSLNPSYYCIRHGIIVSERKRTRTVAELSAKLEIPQLGVGSYFSSQILKILVT